MQVGRPPWLVAGWGVAISQRWSASNSHADSASSGRANPLHPFRRTSLALNSAGSPAVPSRSLFSRVWTASLSATAPEPKTRTAWDSRQSAQDRARSTPTLTLKSGDSSWSYRRFDYKTSLGWLEVRIPYFAASASLIAATTAGASGLSPGSKRLRILPSRPTRNLPKFHFTSPGKGEVGPLST